MLTSWNGLQCLHPRPSEGGQENTKKECPLLCIPADSTSQIGRFTLIGYGVIALPNDRQFGGAQDDPRLRRAVRSD